MTSSRLRRRIAPSSPLSRPEGQPAWIAATFVPLARVLLAVVPLLAACGGADGTATSLDTVMAADGAADAAASDAATDVTTDVGGTDGAALPLDITAADFDCLKGWTKVRGFYLKSLLGSVDAALAVANNPEGGVYPTGTVIQLVPTEAMVKREPGFSAQTRDWEFFFLKVDAKGSTIVDRGATQVKNGFGGNCFGCHNKAEPKWDLVCEQDHGCDPLPIGGAVIRAIQDNDPRCK